MKQYLFFILITITITRGWGQDESEASESNSLNGVPCKDRIVTGGGLGLGFSSVQDYFMISPQIGYMVTKKFMAGTGLTYQYVRYKIVRPAVSSNNYGVNPFLRYFIYRNIFAQAEYEYLNYEFPFQGETTRKGFNSIMAGGGFIQPLGSRAAFYVIALYNFSYKTPLSNEYSPYPSPLIIRAGINIGNFSF